MPRGLRYTNKALADLRGISRWLTQPGAGAVAKHRLRTIQVTINQLRDHPCLYPVGQHPGVREVPCDGGYRALYEVHPDTGRDATAGDVRILRVFGPGQSRAGL